MKKLFALTVVVGLLLMSATFAQQPSSVVTVDAQTIVGTYSKLRFTVQYTFDPVSQNTDKQWYDHAGNPIAYQVVLDAERAAYYQQYGTFDQALAATLETKQPTDMIDVGLWMLEPANLPQLAYDLNTILGSHYAFSISPSVPMLSTTMSKADLLKLQFHPAIDRIYENRRLTTPEGELQNPNKPSAPTIFSALQTEYIPPLWAQNFKGQGQKIGLVELGKVRAMSTLNVMGYQSTCPNNFTDHATFVANIAAGNSVISGVAPQASVLSACADSEGALEPALNWLFDQGASVANVSMSDEGDSGLQWSDRIADSIARQRNKFIAVGAGNGAGFVGSPAKAYNVTSVGAFLDMNSMTWNDDVMWWNNPTSGSAFGNPVSNKNDREKPEVVAVGEITTYKNENISDTDIGTSYAAPQVAGLATLMVNVNSQLSQWPEANKAIIMASAVHNLEGVQSIPYAYHPDLRDGAGALVGTLARSIAGTRGDNSNWFPCIASCWWGIDADNTQLPVGNTVGVRFGAKAGQRVRVVASWWANATPSYHFGLETDFDLTVKTNDFNQVAFSGSYDNNYEMVDFIAPVDGLYRIEVKKAAANENQNKIGIAALVYDQRPFLEKKVFVPLAIK